MYPTFRALAGGNLVAVGASAAGEQATTMAGSAATDTSVRVSARVKTMTSLCHGPTPV